MNQGLERGPLSVARSGVYRSGQRLDSLVGSATMHGEPQVSWGTRRAHPFWLSREGSNKACTATLAVLPAVERPLPACTQGPLGPRVGRPVWKNHEYALRGFPGWRAERMQRLDSMRKLS